jgi:hypothetical protein
VSDETREREIVELRKQLARARARAEGIRSELTDFQRRIREVREALGNPFYYSGSQHGRAENAEKSIEKFTGYGGHEVGLQLLCDLEGARAELDLIRAKLRDAGEPVD